MLRSWTQNQFAISTLFFCDNMNRRLAFYLCLFVSAYAHARGRARAHALLFSMRRAIYIYIYIYIVIISSPLRTCGAAVCCGPAPHYLASLSRPEPQAFLLLLFNVICSKAELLLEGPRWNPPLGWGLASIYCESGCFLTRFE